jgi:dTDP-4-dehydrorhamnose 3,5-epimerase
MATKGETIQGVKLKRLRAIPDERGRLTEILRSDDDMFAAYPGVVKGWHYHKKQTDNMAVVQGMMKIVLFDSRDGSPTQGQINEFFVGVHNPLLVQIPPYVLHGFKCISECEAIVVNIATEVYNYDDPDEYKMDPHDNDIPYSWERKDG